MPDYSTLAILVAFLFCYSAVAERLEKTPFSGAVIFAGFGALCGPLGFDVFRLDIDVEGLKSLAEWTLAVVLFTDAADANVAVLRSIRRLPERLLLVGLPLTIALGVAVGAVVMDGVSLVEIAILATMLAPTDAALGQAVETNPQVPSKVRECLNVESGLNDGICVPVLFIFLALASSSEMQQSTAGLALRLVIEEIGIGAGVGLGLAVIAYGILRVARARGWIGPTWAAIPIVAAAMTCFATAQALGGSGFIASFVGGLVFGALAGEAKRTLLTEAESTGHALSLLTWVVFGVAVIGRLGDGFDWRALVYAVLSLTVIRMLPVYLALSGTGLSARTRLFIGWFGPRGLASVVFIIIVLAEDLPGNDLLALTVVYTITLSILAHGLSAVPLATAYGASVREDQL